MIYLVVGLDHDTLTPWHRNVQAVDVTTAKQIALARAEAQGVSLVVAAVIGTYSSVISARPPGPELCRAPTLSNPAAARRAEAAAARRRGRDAAARD